jgi:glycine cleavage system H protein
VTVSSYPSEYKYSRDHEWVRVDGDVATIGITSYAQIQLGEVVFVELPDVGRTFAKGDECGTIESVKAVGELYCPVGGEVVEGNQAVVDDPSMLNDDPHGEGWLVRMRMSDSSELDGLMDATAYAAYVSESA